MKREKNPRQRGFTLIEALVALLVLSIGLLGVAAMQLKSLQGAHAAYQRSIASLAAQDAQERLWAELENNSGTLFCPNWGDANVLTDPAWEAIWESYLPGFSSNSEVNQPDEDICEFKITISWTDGRLEGGGDSFVYRVRLPGET